MPKVTMVEAINLAHMWEMARDPAVVVLGEDVGLNGGVFRATVGLQQRFGAERVQDAPLAEVLSLLSTLEEAWKAVPDSVADKATVAARNPWAGASANLVDDEPVRLALSA